MATVQGVVASAVTPRSKEGGADLSAAFELIDHLCAAGVRGIALFGAAGEYAALSFEERTRLAYLAVKRSRAPVYAGIGAATLHESLALAREMRDAGAAGLLLPPPYFFPYSQDEVREFYVEFAAQLGGGAATYLYNIPQFTSAIEPETAISLLETGGFAGVADAAGDLQSLLRLRDAGCAVLTSDDAIFAPARCAGVSAALSEAACAVPELMVALESAVAGRRREEAARLDALLHEFLSWAGQFPPPVAVRTATRLRGLKIGALPAPLPAEKRRKLDEFQAWFEAWLPGVKRDVVA
jgi:4-hydroxy-tetrahydrodipicolinate synthase